jgi:hypothetical protein
MTHRIKLSATDGARQHRPRPVTLDFERSLFPGIPQAPAAQQHSMSIFYIISQGLSKSLIFPRTTALFSKNSTVAFPNNAATHHPFSFFPPPLRGAQTRHVIPRRPTPG